MHRVEADIRLGQLIAFTDIQRMLEAHYRAAGMPSGIIDAFDGTVLAGTGWQDICVRFHRAHPGSAANCRESDLAISAHIRDGRTHGYKCPNGMWDIGIPIFVSGRHVATFFLGQFLFEEEAPDRAFFEAQAERMGYDREAYLEALDRVPVFSRAKVENILEYNKALAAFIGSLAEGHLLQRGQLAATEAARKDAADQRMFLRSVFETIPAPLFTKDATLAYSGCNAAFERMAGMPCEKIIGRRAEDLFPPEMAELFTTLDHALLATGEKQDYQVRVPSPDGGHREVQFHKALLRDASGQGSGVVGIGFDITERLEAEREVERSRNLITNILESAPSAIVGVDERGLVNHWNHCARKFFGRQEHEVRGRPLEEALPFMAGHKDKLEQALAERRVGMIEKLPLKVGDTRRLLDIQLYPLSARDSCGVVIRADDVSERERLREMMIQTEKMMSVGGLAAGMAHEINNPLGAVLQSAQLIEMRLSPEREANREAARAMGLDMDAVTSFLESRNIFAFLENIREAGIRAGRIVANMLDFSRRSDSSKESVPLARILDRSLELASSDYDLRKRYDFRHVKITRDYEPDLPPVFCATMEIEQVMLNLLRNAAQAMAAKQYGEGEGPAIALRLSRRDGMAVVEVEDNGPGIEQAIRRKVFEPFFTTKGPGEGTGLGLSVSYFIVANNHAGSIRAEEAPGGGARMVFELPFEPGK